MNEEESQQSIECKAAIRAALEKVGEYCGLGGMGPEIRTIEIKGVRIDVPTEIYEIAVRRGDDPSMGDRKRGEIERSRWARDKAAELCADWWKLLSRKGYEEPLMGEDMDECIRRVASEMANQVLTKWG
jgi:hypothetical protein